MDTQERFDVTAPGEFSTPILPEPVDTIPFPVSMPRRTPASARPVSSQQSVPARKIPAALQRAATAFCCLGLVLTLVGKRDRIVAAAPQTAALYASMGLPVNLRGLQFREVKSILSVEGSRRILLVEGQIANIRPKNSVVPDLRVSVQAGDGREVYHWTIPPPKMQIAAGETVAFRTRLDASPADGRDVKVAFSSPDTKLALASDTSATRTTRTTRSP